MITSAGRSRFIALSFHCTGGNDVLIGCHADAPAPPGIFILHLLRAPLQTFGFNLVAELEFLQAEGLAGHPPALLAKAVDVRYRNIDEMRKSHGL